MPRHTLRSQTVVAAGLALVLLLGASAAEVEAASVTVRSGEFAGSLPSADLNVTRLDGPDNSGFANTFTSGDFTAAAGGAAARVLKDLNGSWAASLAADSTAKWIGTNDGAGGSPGGNTALYAIAFDLGASSFVSATLDLYFMTDDELGDSASPTANQGLFINGTAIAGTSTALGSSSFMANQSFLGLDVTSLVTTGVNTLYINARDNSGAAGLIFSATFTTVSATVIPLPASAWTGLSMLGALFVLGRRKRRLARVA